jgi:REP element-mobilizing transposase RayT
MSIWNDTDVPLAHLISFRSHGTWLHGDERGSTDRFNNVYRSPHIPASERWHQYNQRTLKADPITLAAEQRASVEKAIRETCRIRRWSLHALNVRTNHVHVVVSIGYAKASRALNALKANATRQMREDGNWKSMRSPWADKGSQRNLWNERSVTLAVDYVINGQGGDLPDFD